jgi:hypothetical protein
MQTDRCLSRKHANMISALQWRDALWDIVQRVTKGEGSVSRIKRTKVKRIQLLNYSTR